MTSSNFEVEVGPPRLGGGKTRLWSVYIVKLRPSSVCRKYLTST